MNSFQVLLPFFSAIFSAAQVLGFSDPYVKLTSDGPVVLDATISFTAQLINSEDYDPPFYYSWADDASPGHWNEQTTDDRVAHWNITYASKYKYEEREYKTTVRVFYQNILTFREILAEETIKYKVTKDLNGVLTFHQTSATKGHIIRSTEQTEFSVSFHDPSGFLDNAALQFFWFVDDTNYGMSEANSFHNTFASPGHYTVEVIVMAQVSGENRGQLLPESDSRSLSSSELLSKAPPYLKTGVFRTQIESRTPITKFNYTGEAWINAGKMLELTMKCDGSGPWKGCWSTKPVPYNMTGNETCSDNDEFVLTDSCNFPIVWYFRQAGFHNILAIVDNGVSNNSMLILTNMYNSTVTPPISVVIIPVSCSLVSLFGIGFGLITFYYCRRKVAVETADFDFNSPEEQLEYKTFWERLRDSMMNAFSNSSDDVSHVSSVSSKSIQHPGTSIHYGSIS